MKKEFTYLGGFLATFLFLIPAYSISANDSNEILLKSRHFTPQRGITSSAKAVIEALPQRAHVLLQLERWPTIEDINYLENAGVKLFSYIPNNAWLASIPSDKTDQITAIANVRSISEILPDDKISPHIKSGNIFEPGVKDGKTAFIIEFFEDVPAIEIEETIAGHNGLITGWVPILNAVEAVLHVEEGIALASEEGVKWLEQELPLEPTNNGIRAAIGVNNVQAPPYNLNGAGVNVLVYDSGLVDNTHSDLVNRVIIGEDGYISGHSTHVAGTVAGDGTLSSGKYRGMAPSVNIISYHYDCNSDPCICLYDKQSSINDMVDNFSEGITTHFADIITASIGAQPARWGISCDYEGDYSEYARYVDSFVSMHIPITWAAANERYPYWWGYWWRPCGEYYTISPTATAKNAIVVGAVNSNDNSMTGFSSWGPTDDGRIKPDIVAPGCENDPCNNTNDPNQSIWSTKGSSYGGYCGTSMATPAVAGSIALLLQQWRNTHPGQDDPPPSAIKAMLINTAVDLGNTGPDYSFGYGLLDVKAAVDLISDTNNYKIFADWLGALPEFTIEVPQNTSELKVTLAWDDAPAEPLADMTLVYDADLIIREPNGTRHYPWILNPSSPNAPATRGEDHINNVEQVCVTYPIAGTWTVDINTNSGIELNYAVVWEFPNFFGISKEDDIPDGNNCLPGDNITYSIHYSYPLDHNMGDIDDVIITDFLPDDLIFVSASGPNTVYDSFANTVTWNIGTLEPNESGSVTLTATVSDCISACGAIINSCKISGGGWTSWASENTPVLCASNPSPPCWVSDSFCSSGNADINLTWCPGYFAAVISPDNYRCSLFQ
jgi:hypothetical protein